MALPVAGLLVLAGVGALAYAALKSTDKKKGRLPKLLSDDCSRQLISVRDWESGMRVMRWGAGWMERNPLPQVPSDPDTMRGYVARYVMAIMEDGAPHCTYLFDERLVDWPLGARQLFEQAVYSTTLALRSSGYNVNVPERPPTW